jgi:Tol biopolymer transport system component
VLLFVIGVTFWGSERVTGEPPTFGRVVRLTSGPGLEFGPAVSPDGKWVAYFANTRGPIDIWVKFLSGGGATNLTSGSGLELPTRVAIGGLAISPDGTSIAFDAGAKPGTPANLFDSWVIAAPLGGVPRKLVERGRSVRWSPDGTQITYVRAGAAAGDSLYVANADGTHERQVVGTRGGMHVHWPAWSADGRYIYFSYSATTANAEPSEIYRVATTGGRLEPVVSTARRALFPAPMADGIGLLYAANPLTAEAGVWWRSLVSDVPPRPLAAAVAEYADLTVARQSGAVVASLVESRQALAVLPVGGGSAAGSLRTLTDGFTGDQYPTVSPRGDRILFASTREGSRNLWRAEGNGGSPQPLTSGIALDERPSFSPDGQRIAFVSDRGGQRGIWIMNADGGAPRLVTQATVLDTVSWSPDGRELVYSTPIGDAPGLWIVTVESGVVRRLTTPGPAISPVWCPTGDLIAYIEAQPPADDRPNSSGVAFVNRAGEQVKPGLVDSPNVLNGFLAWAPDGQHLGAFVEPGASQSAIWLLDTSGVESPKRLATLPPGVRIRGASWWPDGTAIVLSQIHDTSDIVLFEP